MLGHRGRPQRGGPKLRLGLCVRTDTGRRNPAVTAQAAGHAAALTITQLTGAAFILGIGSGEREGNEACGVAWDPAVAPVRGGAWPPFARCGIPAVSWSIGIRRIFRCATQVFDSHRPYRGKWPPIWIAAHVPGCCGRRSLRRRLLSGVSARAAEYAQRLAVVPGPPRPMPAAIPSRSFRRYVVWWSPAATRDVEEALDSEVFCAGA